MKTSIFQVKAAYSFELLTWFIDENYANFLESTSQFNGMTPSTAFVCSCLIINDRSSESPEETLSS